jgi:myo-inositol-1(or 4)-monophosphatase
LCFVSAGRLDGYFEVGLNAWDWAAGALIAEEAGCVVSGLPGRPIGQPVVAAAGGSVAPDLLALLEVLDVTDV